MLTITIAAEDFQKLVENPQANGMQLFFAGKLKVAQSPGGMETLGAQLEGAAGRLREIVGQLQSGESFTPQQLLAMQAEMNDITLQIEVTTKVVAETVSGVRQLMQQQA